MFKVTPKETVLFDGVMAYRVTCPICGCERLELEGNVYQCCECGFEFQTEYAP
jgi:predicted RNA-binding Zn-ribbon protein involved in translation (DUF1610 family)